MSSDPAMPLLRCQDMDGGGSQHSVGQPQVGQSAIPHHTQKVPDAKSAVYVVPDAALEGGVFAALSLGHGATLEAVHLPKLLVQQVPNVRVQPVHQGEAVVLPGVVLREGGREEGQIRGRTEPVAEEKEEESHASGRGSGNVPATGRQLCKHSPAHGIPGAGPHRAVQSPGTQNWGPGHSRRGPQCQRFPRQSLKEAGGQKIGQACAQQRAWSCPGRTQGVHPKGIAWASGPSR